MTKTAVVFDMDGVIFDSEKIVIECWRELSERFGFADFENVYHKCIGVNINKAREIFKEAYGQDFDYDYYRSESSKLFLSKSNNGQLPVKAGTVQLLKYLKGNNYLIGLASSTRQEVVHKELKLANLYDYFDCIICGDMISKSKPDPEIYLKACEKLKVNPADTYAIEDAYNGVNSAYNAGMITIMVPDMLAPNDEMREKAKFIFDDLNEVRKYFETK